MFMREQSARTNYIQKIRFNKDASSNYFEDNEDDKKKRLLTETYRKRGVHGGRNFLVPNKH